MLFSVRDSMGVISGSSGVGLVGVGLGVVDLVVLGWRCSVVVVVVVVVVVAVVAVSDVVEEEEGSLVVACDDRATRAARTTRDSARIGRMSTAL